MRGLNNKLKRQSIFNKVRKDYDIFLLQETYATEKTAGLWESEWGGKIYRSDGGSNARGVAILINRKMDCVVHSCKRDTNGRRVTLDITLKADNIRIVICCIYAPNVDDKAFFAETIQDCSQLQCENILLGGDFNLVLDEKKDCKYRRNNNIESRNYLCTTMEEINMWDAWRLVNPEKNEYTWFRRKPTRCMSRIDMFLVTGELIQCIKKCDIKMATQTDHSQLHLVFEAEEVKRGPGYWRFNNLLLNDESFIEELNSKIDLWENIHGHLEIKERWEVIKQEICRFCREAGIKRKRKQSQEECNLNIMAERITHPMETTDSPDGYMEALEDIKKRIEVLEEEQAKSAALPCTGAVGERG